MPIINVNAAADAKAFYRNSVVQSGVAAFKNTKDTSAALQAMASTALGAAGAAVCGAVTGGVGALICGPAVSAAVNLVMNIASSIFGSGPNLIKLKRDACVKTLTELENQYLDQMQNLLMMYYQYWPEDAELDKKDPQFYPAEFTAYAEPRSGKVSILRWNAIAQLLIESGKASSSSAKRIPFDVVSELWYRGTRKYSFPVPVYIPPVLALAAVGDPCLAFTQRASLHLPVGALVWTLDGTQGTVASRVKTAGGGRAGGAQTVLHCPTHLLPVQFGGSGKSGGGAVKCIDPNSLFQENPLARIQKVIDWLNPAADLLPEAVNRALFYMAAQKSAEEIEKRAAVEQVIQNAADAKGAYQGMVAMRQAEIRDLDRQLDDAQDQLASAKEAASAAHAAQEDVDRAAEQTKWAWIAGAVIVGGIVIWGRR